MAKDPPKTPRKPRGAGAPSPAKTPFKSTPSRAALARWEAMVASDDEHEEFLHSISLVVKEILGPVVTTDKDEANLRAFILMSALVGYINEHDLESTIIPVPEEDTRAQKSPDALTSQASEPASSAEEAGSEDEEYRPRKAKRAGPSDITVANILDTTRRGKLKMKNSHTFVQENVAAETRSGQTREDALFIGDDGLAKYNKPTFNLTSALSKPLIQDKQKALADRLLGLAVEVKIRRRLVWHAIRPTVINHIINFFTYELIGIPGLRRLSNILTEHKAGTMNAATVNKIRNAKDRTKLVSEDLYLRRAIEDYIIHSTTQEGDYVAFRDLSSQYHLTAQWNYVVELLEHVNDQDSEGYDFAQHIRTYGLAPSQGIGWKTLLGQYYHQVLGIDPDELSKNTRHGKLLVEFCHKFGGPGILLLLPRAAPRIFSRWTKTMFDAIITEVAEEFVDIERVGRFLTENIYKPLRKGKTAEIVSTDISLRVDAVPFLERIQKVLPSGDSTEMDD